MSRRHIRLTALPGSKVVLLSDIPVWLVDDSAGWQPISTAGFDPARAGQDRYAIYVWRSERHGGDTQTEKSRRTLALPHRCVEALLWGSAAVSRSCGASVGSCRPGMEHQVPQLPGLMTTFRVPSVTGAACPPEAIPRRRLGAIWLDGGFMAACAQIIQDARRPQAAEA